MEVSPNSREQSQNESESSIEKDNKASLYNPFTRIPEEYKLEQPFRKKSFSKLNNRKSSSLSEIQYDSSDSSESESEESPQKTKIREFHKVLKVIFHIQHLRLQRNQKFKQQNQQLTTKKSDSTLKLQKIIVSEGSSEEERNISPYSQVYGAMYPDYSPCLPPVNTKLENRRPHIEINIPSRIISRNANHALLNVPKIFDLPTFNFSEMPCDWQLFMYSPVPRGKVLQLTIVRDKSGFRKLWPEYNCYFSENMNKEIMFAKKKPKVISSLYVIGLDSKGTKSKSENILGKLKSNFIGTVFDLFDSGLNPKTKKATLQNLRSQFATFIYKSQIFQEQSLKEVLFIIHKLNDYNSIQENKPKSISEEIYQKFQNLKQEQFQVFANKQPTLNEDDQTYSLDFGDRVEIADKNNFQIVRKGEEQEVYLQFGKVDQNKYNLDLKYPFSPFQAFAIALSTLDYKIACD